jgi:hypothetical protein
MMESDEHHQQQEHQQEEDDTSTSNPTLPQHQQPQPREVEPLDISYRYTHASLKLKETLLLRLSVAAPTGRIQVVSVWFCSCVLSFSVAPFFVSLLPFWVGSFLTIYVWCYILVL